MTRPASSERKLHRDFLEVIEGAREDGLGQSLEQPALDVIEALPDVPRTTRRALAAAAARLKAASIGQLLSHDELPSILLEQLTPREAARVVIGVLDWLDGVDEEAEPEDDEPIEPDAAPSLFDPFAGQRPSTEPPGSVPPAAPDDLEAWARAHGLERLIRAPLHSALRAASRFGTTALARLPENATVLDAFVAARKGSAATRDTIRQWILPHLRELLADASELAEREAARRKTLEQRAKEPEAPEAQALLAWLREARARLVGEHTPAPGTASVGRITFAKSPPRLEVAVVLPAAAEERIAIPLSDFRTRPYEGPAGSFVGLDAAIDLLRDPADPQHQALLTWLTTPVWPEVIGRIDQVLAAGSTHVASHRVAFRLVPSNHSFSVHPVVQKPLLRGAWSVGSLVKAERLLQGGGEVKLDELEERVLLWVLESERPWLPPAQRKAIFYQLVDLLSKHPRVFFEGKPEAPVRIRRERVRVELVADGDNLRPELWLGDLRLDPAQFRPLIDERGRALVYDPERAFVAITQVDGAALALIAAMAEQTIVFPPESHGALVDRALKLQSSIDVSLPQSLEGRSIEPDLRPVARLEPLEPGLKLSVMVRPVEGGGVFPPGDGPPRAAGEQGGERVNAARDFEAERARAQALLDQIGLGASDGGAPFSRALLDDEEALSAMAALEPLAVAGEVSVEWPEGGPKVVGRATAAGLRVRVKKRRDYFGVDGGVEVDGQLVALADLLEAARKGRRYVALGHRRFLEVTSELRDRLSAADGVLFATKNGLETSPLAVAQLSQLVERDEQIEADHELSELRARIEHASALEPEAPSGLSAELRPYQLEGYRWLARLSAWGAGGCLADEMGLGKTLQALSVLVERAPLGPQLVVAPTSVCANWVSEARRFAPGLRPLLYRGPKRAPLLERAGPGDVLIASYDVLARDAEPLAAREMATLVFDEAQSLKNAQTRRAKASVGLEGGFRVALTGTPVENHLGELWSIFRVAVPGLLGSWEHFQTRFAAPIERDGSARARASLARVVRPFLLRRTKAQVAPELPERIEVVRHVELSPAERSLYEAARQKAVAALAHLDDAPQDGRFQILAELTRLRRLACHPRLHDPASPVPSSKLSSFLELWAELHEEGHRALVFSQFTSHLALVREALETRKVPYLYLDGSTPAERRAELVETFQRGEYPLFLISLKAGGTGLNLTAADTVIHLDPWWNPAVEDQASDRAHRIGQTRAVTVVRLICRGTIEEAVVALHAEKRELADSLLEGAEVAGRLSTAELSALVLAGDAEQDGDGDLEPSPAPPPADRADRADRPESAERPERTERTERSDRPDLAEHSPAPAPARPSPRPAPPPRAEQAPPAPAPAPRALARDLPPLPATKAELEALMDGWYEDFVTERGKPDQLGVPRQYRRSLQRFADYVGPRLGSPELAAMSTQALFTDYLEALSAKKVEAPSSEETFAKTVLNRFGGWLRGR